MPSAPPEPAPPMSMAPNKRDVSAAAGRRSHQTPTGVRQGGRCRRGASVRAWDWQREERARSAAVRRASPPPPSPPPLWRGAGEGCDDARELAPLTPAPAPCGGTACAPALLRLLAHAAAVPGPFCKFWRPLRTLPQFDSHLEPWVLGANVAFDHANLHAHPLSLAWAQVCVQTRVRGAPLVYAGLLSGVCALVSKSRGVCLQRWNFPRELQLYASQGSALALHVRA